MHQNRFLLGLRPRHLGELIALPKGSNFYRRNGVKRRERRKERKGKGREGQGISPQD